MDKIKNFIFNTLTGVIVTVLGGLIVWDLTVNKGKQLINLYKNLLAVLKLRMNVICIIIFIIILIVIIFKQISRKKVTNNQINNIDLEVSSTSLSYKKTEMEGIVEFDYSDNDGLYTIGSDDFEFTTMWSKSSDKNIHAYKDPDNIKKIALVKNRDIKDLEGNLIDISKLNFSSRSRTPNIGDIVVWININNNIAFTKILAIKDDERDADNDYLKFEYYIFSTSEQLN